MHSLESLSESLSLVHSHIVLSGKNCTDTVCKYSLNIWCVNITYNTITKCFDFRPVNYQDIADLHSSFHSALTGKCFAVLLCLLGYHCPKSLVISLAIW